MAGALSARGALAADVVKDWSRTVMLEANSESNGRILSAFREMEREAQDALLREGFKQKAQRHERLLAARYKGQSFELEIRWKPNLDVVESFHQAHLSRYGYAQNRNAVEIVSARLRSTGLVEKLRTERKSVGRGHKAQPSFYATVYFSERGGERTAIYNREELKHGARLQSPCIITEYSATTLVPAGARARVDSYGNIIIEP
jgi:N-methylhydantoinase A